MAIEIEVAPPLRQSPGRMSREEFLDWCDSETRAEWVDGKVIVMSPSSRRDSRLGMFLTQILGIWVTTRQLGELYTDIFMRLSRSDRVPDLLFVKTEHLDRMEPTRLAGPADLAVEIISPDSISRDRGAKYFEYEEAGVPEYWLIDGIRQQAEFYQVGEHGRYRLVLGGRSGRYESGVVEGFWLEVDWLWQDPLPQPLDILRRLGLLPG